jgi:preprotein translocase subunit SecY
MCRCRASTRLRCRPQFNTTKGGVLDFFNMFSGGALERMSLIALGVMPYITASIVVQLAASLSPALRRSRRKAKAGARSSTSIPAMAPCC